MSSKWADRVSQALGLRLAAWYLGTFLASTVVIGVLTYGLLGSLLEQRDHDIIQSTLREYATRYQAGGLPALARAIEIEQRSGIARAAVREAGRSLRRRAVVLAAGNMGRIRSVGAARRAQCDLVAGPIARSQRGPRSRHDRCRRSALAGRQDERSPQSTAVQLPARVDARRRLRARHRRGRRHVPDAIDAEAAARSARCGAAHPADRPDRRSRAGLRDGRYRRRAEHALQRHARAHHDADPRHAQRARSRRARSAHADDAAARDRGIGPGDQ